MKWWCMLLLLHFVTCNAKHAFKSRIVKTAQGPVRGYLESSGVYAFYNIPYARAPTGKHKFKAPMSPPKWSYRPFEAIDKGVICPQAKFGSNIPSKAKHMQEDCLIANIFLPETREKYLSVVLYIHGGAFQAGYGNHRTAKELMKTKKVIVVTFNYRLGLHGFLCLGTKDIPGNAGMKDMVAMLSWLRMNIADFGGNPYDITVSGYSTGATAADLLILSKSAKTYIKQVIIESGSNTAEFAIQSNPLELAKLQAKVLNFTDVENIDALENFYKTMTFEAIVKSKEFKYGMGSTFIFVPCLENNHSEHAFLTDSPINILKTGDYTKVPMLYGFTNMEGAIRASFLNKWKTAMNLRFSDFLPSDLAFHSEEQKKNVAKLIKEFYFGKSMIDSSSTLAYVNYITDIMYALPALRSVSLNVANGNQRIYLYHYTYVDENDPYILLTRVRGASHCAQSLVIFDDLVKRNRSARFKYLRKSMRSMWRNFIRTSNPVPKGSLLSFNYTWPPTTIERSPHMSFDRVVKLEGKLLETRARFWDGIYEKYYREPVPPPVHQSSIQIRMTMPKK